MAKCIRCGQKGLFFKVNASGHCADCAAIVEAKRKAEIEQQKKKDSPAPRKTIFDIKMDGKLPKYTYTKVKLDTPVVYPSTIMPVGKVCGLFPMDQYSDTIEVRISHGDDDLLIGLLPPGRLAEMARDWFDRSWTSAGQIAEIVDKSIYIDLAFWPGENK